MRCPECRSVLRKIGRRDEIAELSEDATNRQTADYFAAELSGNNGASNLDIIEYYCARCETSYVSFNSLLRALRESGIGL